MHNLTRQARLDGLPVRSEKEYRPATAFLASSLRCAMRVSGYGALIATVAGLAGCGNSSSGKADSAAAYASGNAAGLTVSAGDYRPATPFPVSLHGTLSSTVLESAIRQAKQSPATYLSPRSTLRDLRHASALLNAAMADSGLRHNFKSVLEAQKGQVELLAAQHRINHLSEALVDMTSRFNIITQESALLNSDRLKISSLRTQYKVYAVMHKNALHAAVKAQKTAQSRLAEVRRGVARLKKLLGTNLVQRDTFSINGMNLVNVSQNSTGTTSLNQYKKAMTNLNMAAKYAATAEVLKARLAQALDQENLAAMQVHAANRHVRELAAARKVAAGVSAGALRQIAALQAGAKAIIVGSAGNHSVPTVQDQFVAVKEQLAIALKQADSAQILCQQSRQDLQQAAFDQSKNYTYASQLVSRGLRPNDPLILANENRSLQALFNLQAAIASIHAAMVSQLKLQALKLQALCARTGESIYPLVNEASPVGAPTSAEMLACSKAAKDALTHATVDAGEALASGPSGRSPVKWLAPAISFEANVALADVTADPALKAKYLQLAAQEAGQANTLNPFLKLVAPTK